MAEKAEKPPKEEAAPAESAKKAGGVMGMFKSTPIVLGVVMVLEAGALFAGFKFLGGGPKGAEGASLATGDGHGDGHGDAHGGTGEKGKPAIKNVELPVLQFRAANKQSGRTFHYELSIYVVAKAEKKDTVEQLLKAKEATIQDRVRTIIAQSDPEKLGGGSEPGLETLRRQVKYQLDEVLGEGVIDEVLIPRCIPFRLDY
jgi:flagellar basal body-associated protein FliL